MAGLHSVGVRDSIDALNGIGHAAMMTDDAMAAARDAERALRERNDATVAQARGAVAPVLPQPPGREMLKGPCPAFPQVRAPSGPVPPTGFEPALPP